MIKRPFREHHILTCLEDYEKQNLPLDLFLSLYFRHHKALGAKDRGFVADTIYGLIRWKSLIDYLCKSTPTWEKRLDTFLTTDVETYKNETQIPLYIRYSCPQPLFELLVKNFGEEKACEFCWVNNQKAPLTVRINPLRTTREALLQLWEKDYPVSPSQYSKYGIVFHKKFNLFSLPEFKSGLFEIQDEGSQLLSELIQASPGQQVLDYCSGSGGKTLAFAPGMQGKGQIFLHDIRPHVLLEAKKRLKRAGIQNAQIVQPEDPKLKKLKKKMDWVLVDAPCSGTGTLRRNPDMKWKFSEEMLMRLVGQQRMIFEKALSFLKPNGRIVYSTCSLLKEENQEQIDHFIKIYGLTVEGTPFQSLPADGGMDSFFGAVLRNL